MSKYEVYLILCWVIVFLLLHVVTPQRIFDRHLASYHLGADTPSDDWDLAIGISRNQTGTTMLISYCMVLLFSGMMLLSAFGVISAHHEDSIIIFLYCVFLVCIGLGYLLSGIAIFGSLIHGKGLMILTKRMITNQGQRAVITQFELDAFKSWFMVSTTLVAVSYRFFI